MSKSLVPSFSQENFKFKAVIDPNEPQNKETVQIENGLFATIWMAFNGTVEIKIKCPDFDKPHRAQIYLFKNQGELTEHGIILPDFNFDDVRLERHIAFHSPKVVSAYKDAAYAMSVLVDTVEDILGYYKGEIFKEKVRIDKELEANKELKRKVSLAKMKNKLK